MGHPCAGIHGHSFQAKVFAEVPASWGGFRGVEGDRLQEALLKGIHAWNYQLLDRLEDNRGDESLALRLRELLAVPELKCVCIDSRKDQGVSLVGSRLDAWRHYRFEAAHQLPHVPVGHKCGNMHGHGFGVKVQFEIPTTQGTALSAYETLDLVWAPLHQELHFACLNDLQGLENPTSEVLSRWIWNRLYTKIPGLHSIVVYETDSTGCRFDGQTHRIWKEFSVESALVLCQAPEGDQRRHLHGHSYRFRLHLEAEIDPHFGWSVDYGDVKTLFSQIHNEMDHHRLDQLKGLTGASPEELLRWIKVQSHPILPTLTQVDLFTSPGRGASLHWGQSSPWFPT